MSGARAVLRELERSSPDYAGMARQSRRELRVWRKERDALAEELGRLQAPLIVVALGDDEFLGCAAGSVIRASNWLFDHDAPGEMIRDLLASCGKVWGR